MKVYLVRTGHTTRYVHSDHLIRAHDEPNDANELDLAVPQSCEQSVQAVDVNLVSDSFTQLVFRMRRLNVVLIKSPKVHRRQSY